MVLAIAAAAAGVLVLGSLGAGGPRRAAPPVVIEVPSGDPLPAANIGRGTPGRRLAAVAATTIVVALLAGAVPTLAVLLGLAAWPRLRSITAARSQQSAIDAALPDAVEMLILVVHAGLTPYQAVAALAGRAPLPVRSAFAEVVHRTTRGATLADAIGALGELLGPAADGVADTIAMSERHGTPIGSTLEQLARDVRERRRRQAEAAARRLPVRMSFPLVACTLPSFVLVAIVPAVLAALSTLGDHAL